MLLPQISRDFPTKDLDEEDLDCLICCLKLTDPPEEKDKTYPTKNIEKTTQELESRIEEFKHHLPLLFRPKGLKPVRKMMIKFYIKLFAAYTIQQLRVPLTEKGNDCSRAILTICGHIFGNDCLEKWFRLKRTCPVCRAPLAGSAHQELQELNQLKWESERWVEREMIDFLEKNLEDQERRDVEEVSGDTEEGSVDIDGEWEDTDEGQ